MQFDEYKITLSKASQDDKGNNVVESTEEVYWFDKITEVIASKYRVSKPQCSCDALYIKDDDHIYLIEFKNARISRVPKKSVKEKAYDSIMTLQLAFFPTYSLKDMCKKVTFVFVYNNEEVVEIEQESKTFEKIKNKVSQLAGSRNNILFELDIYKDILYKDIITVEKTEFMNQTYQMIFG